MCIHIFGITIHSSDPLFQEWYCEQRKEYEITRFLTDSVTTFIKTQFIITECIWSVECRIVSSVTCFQRISSKTVLWVTAFKALCVFHS